MIAKDVEICKELLDYHKVEVRDQTPKDKALKKKIIERIKKEQQQNHSFRYLTRNIIWVQNSSIKRFYIKDFEGKIVETYCDKESIEKKIIEFNENHYK